MLRERVNACLSLFSWRDHPIWNGFLVSIMIHLLLGGIVELGWLDWLNDPPTIEKTETGSKASEKQKNTPRTKLRFVRVAPSKATEQAPKDPEYYSSHSTRAANPEPKSNQSDTPEVEGKESKVIRTENVVRSKPASAQPSASSEKKAAQQRQSQANASKKKAARKRSEPRALDAPEPGPMEPEPGVGDLAMAKPRPRLRPGAEEARSSPQETSKRERKQRANDRPRTLKEARARQGKIEGRKSRQEGGVENEGSAALDVKGTSFGAYDREMVAAIQQHWYNLLSKRGYASDAHGRVVVSFRLHKDGRVTQARVVESAVGTVLGLLCQRAIEAPAPYGEWPSDMLRMIGKRYRELRFTFYYN